MKNLVKTWLRRNRKGTYVYYLRWIGEDGKEKYQSLGHSDKRDAERQRREKELELTSEAERPEKMKLTELLEDYLERTRTQIEPSTAKAAKYCMKDFITAIADVYADRITYKYCERFQQYCVDKGLRPASVNTHIKLVKRIFSLVVKRGQLEQNPFHGFPLMKVPKKAVCVFSKDEFERILATAPSAIWKARFLLAKTAGLRRGEVLNLTVSDIDFAGGKVFAQPKEDTKFTWRWVVIHGRKLKPILQALLRKLDQVFLMPDGRQVSPKKLRRYLKTLCRQCGFENPGQYKLHTFRHFFASYCAQQNLSYKYILEWMGHSSSAILDMYFTMNDR